MAYFSAAVALAIATGVPHATIDALGTGFLAVRAAYTWVYATGEQRWKGPARSLLFAAGAGISLYLITLASAAYSAKAA